MRRQKHEDFYGVTPSCGNLIRHQNKDPCPPQAYSWGAGPPGPPSPCSLSVPCDALSLAKGVPACGHADECTTHVYQVSHLMPSFFLMLVTSILHLVNSDLSPPVKHLLIPPHTPARSFIICLLPPSCHWSASPTHPTLRTPGLQQAFS